MRKFIEFYREEAALIFGPKYLEVSHHSVESILWEAKLMVLFAYLIDIIFLLRMASFCKTEEKRAMFLVSFLINKNVKFRNNQFHDLFVSL